MKLDVTKLQVIDEGDKFIFAICPDTSHKDTQASLCINKVPHNNKPKGYYYCFGCGQYGQLIDEEVDYLAQKPSYYREEGCKEKLTSDFWEVWIREAQAETSYADWIHLATDWDIKPLVLSQLDFGKWNDAYTIPMKNEHNEIIGIQFRYNNGFKRCVEGSQLGLFIPTIKVEDIVFITEGASDLVTLLDLGFYGIGRPNAKAKKELVYKWLKINQPNFKKVIIVADNDECGIAGAEELQDYIDSEHTRSEIFIPVQKDLREEVKEFGKVHVKECLELCIGD